MKTEELPHYIIQILTERKHLDSRVDYWVRQGFSQLRAFDLVVEEVRKYVPDCEKVHYQSSRSYVNARNYRRREEIKRIKSKKL